MDNTFDIVYCESVLAILKKNDLELLMHEIHRVLKSGGSFIANESICRYCR